MILLGRTIALGQFTGVSLDGDVFLNIIDVRHEWLSVNIPFSYTCIYLFSYVAHCVPLQRGKDLPQIFRFSFLGYVEPARSLCLIINNKFVDFNKKPDRVVKRREAFALQWHIKDYPKST